MADQMVRLTGSAELRQRYVREVYEAGVRDGMRMLSAAFDERIKAALERPEGHGGADLDIETRQQVLDLYARFFGVGVDPVADTIGYSPSGWHGAGCPGAYGEGCVCALSAGPVCLCGVEAHCPACSAPVCAHGRPDVETCAEGGHDT